MPEDSIKFSEQTQFNVKSYNLTGFWCKFPAFCKNIHTKQKKKETTVRHTKTEADTTAPHASFFLLANAAISVVFPSIRSKF